MYHKDLEAWKKSIELVTKVYEITRIFPENEKYSLVSQMRRAAISIPSNIAEGAAKPSDIEFAHFLDTALGSAFEVETQLLISKNVGYVSEDLYNNLLTELNEIERQLNGLISSLRNS